MKKEKKREENKRMTGCLVQVGTLMALRLFCSAAVCDKRRFSSLLWPDEFGPSYEP